MRALLIVSLLVIGCSGPERAGGAAPKPKLVVLIVVDQLPTWAFDRDRALFTHGFARLLGGGGFVRAGEIPYANPFTAPGHASIGTGAPPSVHGIIGNSWYRRAEGRERDAEYDVAAPLVPVGTSYADKIGTQDGASSRALLVDGVADALRKASPRSKSIAIGLKPRAAAFMAGRKPDLAVWYEADAGGMTTSKAYAAEAPAWLVGLANDKPASRFFAVEWAARDAALLARVTGLADDAPGEGGVHGLDTTFPHSLAESDKPERAFLHTPYGDELVFDAATAAIDAMQLGADDDPDLLALGFNARDYAGHLWGPDSWEVLDLTMRLDERLGSFFELLDTRVGKGAWAVVLTSDHGATRVVERSPTKGARRIRSKEIIEAAELAIEGKLGKGPWVTSVIASNVYLAPAVAQHTMRGEALDAAAAAIAKLPGVAIAGRVDQISGRCGERRGLERALCWSTFPAESGDLYVVPMAGSLISDYKSGTHHDAPFDENRQVPILVFGRGVKQQTGEGTMMQVAPTVCALLRVPPPSGASEPALFGLR
ncbi:MAG: alkaline phosphatase family protein [Myxococcota bacterium]|nr:alkaline phosphatase family protein [Deltaproteobacteria bacterium]MDQ3333925.1 alkaline phosphatase family protein [Myxococcota bacterium]